MAGRLMAYPVIIAPGILEDTIGWQAALSGLRAGFSVIENEGRSIKEMARSMLDRAPDQFVLLGHSLGGYVALEAVFNAPERIVGLVLVSTTARAESAQAKSRRLALVRAAAEDFEGILSKLAHATLARAHRDTWAPVVLEEMRRVGLTTFVRDQHAALTRCDQTGRLGEIACPTLIIAGDDDAVVDPAGSIELSRLIANSSLLRIANCGHIPQHEQKDVLKAALDQWIQSTFMNA
jgi:pimeloyl-ACP methyl ester carboxylesterase